MRLFSNSGFAKPTISKTNIQPKNNPSPAQHIQTNNTKTQQGVDGFNPADDIKRDNALALVKGKKIHRQEATEKNTDEQNTTQKRAGGRKKRVWEFTDEGNYQTSFYAGNIPGFETGVDLEVIEDDKSAAFKKRHAQLLQQGR